MYKLTPIFFVYFEWQVAKKTPFFLDDRNSDSAAGKIRQGVKLEKARAIIDVYS